MPHFERHLFICTNVRPSGHPRGCCAEKGSETIRAEFKRLLKAHGLSGRIRANAAGCLDQCEQGPSVVVYPEQIWYTVPSVEDAREIVVEHLLGGRPVTRLLMQDPPKNAMNGSKKGRGNQS